MSEKWEAQKKLLQDTLKTAVNFYLDNADETAWVTRETWGQGERVYIAAEQEASILEVLVRVAADHYERIFPRLPVSPRRTVPTAAQIFRILEAVEFEQTLQNIGQRIDIAKGQAREQKIDITDELARLEAMSRLPPDDDEAGGAIGVLARVGPPMRGPGGGRTVEEALANPRSYLPCARPVHLEWFGVVT